MTKALGLAALVLLAACHTPAKAPPVQAPIKKDEAKSTPKKAEDKELALENAIGVLVEAVLSMSASEYGDAALSEYVARIGARVAKRSERPEIVWHFRVTDTPSIGAHAVPGGRVTITRGLLAYLGSEAEVAAVLAHEIAHVSFRHSHSKWSPSVAVAEYGDAATAREQARDADQERQADTVGIRYLAEAGYDPNAMAAALAALARGASIELAAEKKADRTGPNIPSDDDDDFDPHPAPPARLARASVAAAGAGKGEWGRESYLARIAGLEWGDGSSVPVLERGRWIARGDLSFGIPRGAKATIERGSLALRSSEKGAPELVAFRLNKSFLSEGLRASLMKGPKTTRTVAGWSALVARRPDPKAPKKTKDEKKDDSLMAILDGPERGSVKPVIVVVALGTTAATERALDAFLATAERDATPATPQSVLAIERSEAFVRFDDFIRRRCPGTTLDIAMALNGRTAADVLPAGDAVKCVKPGAR